MNMWHNKKSWLTAFIFVQGLCSFSLYSLHVILTHIHPDPSLFIKISPTGRTKRGQDKPFIFPPVKKENPLWEKVMVELPCEIFIKDCSREKWVSYYCEVKNCNKLQLPYLKIQKWGKNSSDAPATKEKSSKIFLQNFSKEERLTYGLECYYEFVVHIERFTLYPNVQFNPRYVRLLAFNTQCEKRRAENSQ